jgi:hypothetical protein
MREPDETLPAVRARPAAGLLVWLFALDRPSLTERPQRWGIVPSFRFWNRLDTAKYQMPPVLLGIALMVGAHLLLTVPVVLALGNLLALLVLMPLYLALGLLPLGLFERWLRRTIAARRAP